MEITFDLKLAQHLELRRLALKEHSPDALYWLGRIYSRMEGKKAKKQAYELYRRSAAHAHAEAQFMMGVCCETGTGTRRSEQMAISWYLRAEVSAASDIADHSEFVEETDAGRYDDR